MYGKPDILITFEPVVRYFKCTNFREVKIKSRNFYINFRELDKK